VDEILFIRGRGTEVVSGREADDHRKLSNVRA